MTPLRVSIQDAPVCTYQTSPCVPAKRAHLFSMHAFCRYTRRRFERTHGDVLNLHTGGFPRAKPRYTQTTHTPHTHTPHTPHRTHQHTPHQTPPRTKHTPHCTHTSPLQHTRMLGYAHNRQRTVFLREFQRGEKVNAWICAPRSTDNDPALDKNLQCL